MTRDGDIYHFTINLGRTGSESIQDVVAPLAITFAKLGSDVLSPSSLFSALKDFQTFEVLPAGDTFSVKSDFPAESIKKVYLIRQPILFQDANKTSKCFLVPTYSPVDIPEEWSTCK
ncbi:MAG: hypothetical protein WCF81_21265 [Roseiarcus sp.]